MSRVTRGTPSGDAYLDLQNEARRSGRPTQELLQLYVLEGFLARLAVSEVCGSFALKGGVLLAAFGSRRPTKDVDLAGLDIANDTETVLELVLAVLAVGPAEHDGIEFEAGTATAEVIREEDDYSGVRVHAGAHLASARLAFHVDVNVGDPIWPEPATVAVPRLRGGEPIRLPGYPMHMIHAEKIVTAIQRGTANTRWRDFGDIWRLSRQLPMIWRRRSARWRGGGAAVTPATCLSSSRRSSKRSSSSPTQCSQASPKGSHGTLKPVPGRDRTTPLQGQGRTRVAPPPGPCPCRKSHPSRMLLVVRKRPEPCTKHREASD